MGCASSSPMINGSGGGGIVGAAKHAAADVVHAGEEALHDAGEGINGTVGHMKDAVVGAVHGLDGTLSTATDGAKAMVSDVENKAKTAVLSAVDSVTEFTHIPLRDPNKMDDHLEEFKETLLKKAQSFSDDTDQLTDDLIKDTEDLMVSGATAAESTLSQVTASLPSTTAPLEVDEKTPTHSLDSLRTSSPDPEIEKALSNVDRSKMSPQPTFNELREITSSTIGNSDEPPQPSSSDTAPIAPGGDVQQHKQSNYHQGARDAEGEKMLMRKVADKFNQHANKVYSNTAATDGPDEDILGLGPSNDKGVASKHYSGKDGDSGAEDCSQSTQWELLADAILANPVTRFTDNPVYPTFNVPAIVDNSHNDG